MRRTSTTTILFFALFISTAAGAAVPQALHYSGKLDTAGGAFTGTVDVTFALYEDASAATSFWSDTQAVTVTNGRFHVELGPFGAGDVDVAALHVGVTIGTDNEMDKVAISSVPYALRASEAGNAATVGGQAATAFAAASHSHALADLEHPNCSPGQVLASNGSAWACGDDAKLSSSEVLSFVSDGGYYPGGHTVDTKLTNSEVLSIVSGGGYYSGGHTVDTKLTNSEVLQIVSDGGYTASTSIQGKPFIGRQVSKGNYTTSYQSVYLYPLQGGNHLTPTHIKVEGYRTVGGSGYLEYVLHYADSTSYSSPTYTATSGGWVTLFEGDIPLHASLRGVVTKIELKVRNGSSSSAYVAYGRLTVSGHETSSAGLSAGKPFIGRQVSKGNYTTSYQSVYLNPLQGGNHLTPTRIKVEGYRTVGGSGYVQYVLHYADSTSYSSATYTATSGGWVTLFEGDIPVHDSLRGSVTKIELKVRNGSSSSAYVAYGRLTVSGHETVP